MAHFEGNLHTKEESESLYADETDQHLPVHHLLPEPSDRPPSHQPGVHEVAVVDREGAIGEEDTFGTSPDAGQP